jgi:hypothetical protein
MQRDEIEKNMSLKNQKKKNQANLGEFSKPGLIF